MDWDHIRRVRFSDEPGPADWPKNVRVISLDGLNLLGLDPATNDLYWDGQQIEVRKRLAPQERFLAWIGALSAVIIAVTSVWQLVLNVTIN